MLCDARVHVSFILYLQLKELNHDNIEAFVGASIEPGHICYLMQSCNRGTVQVSPLKRCTMKPTRTVSIFYNEVNYFLKRNFKAHQHKAAGRKTRLDIQNYGCNGNLLCYHGVVERNRISCLQSH